MFEESVVPESSIPQIETWNHTYCLRLASFLFIASLFVCASVVHNIFKSNLVFVFHLLFSSSTKGETPHRIPSNHKSLLAGASEVHSIFKPKLVFCVVCFEDLNLLNCGVGVYMYFFLVFDCLLYIVSYCLYAAVIVSFLVGTFVLPQHFKLKLVLISLYLLLSSFIIYKNTH